MDTVLNAARDQIYTADVIRGSVVLQVKMSELVQNCAMC